MGTYLPLQKPKMSEETTHKELKCNESQEKKEKEKKHTFILSEKLGSCMQRWSLNRLWLLLSDCEFCEQSRRACLRVTPKSRV